jgi:outer membrane protein TolC
MATHKSPLRRILISCLVLIGLLVLATPFVAGNEQEPSGSHERLRALLTERHAILKQMVASVQFQVKNGRADVSALRDATIAMYRAEADLCTSDTARIAVHEKLVDVVQEQEELAARRLAAGRIPTWELDEAKVATLEARIELERLRLAQEATH